MSHADPAVRDARTTPEARAGARPVDEATPEHSRGALLDEAQPSTRHRPQDGPPPAAATLPHGERARLEALLEGVPLPATRADLVRHVRAAAGEDDARPLRGLPDRRFSTIDEVGEALAPVQPQWERERRVPHPESDLPPGGERYGG
jgi:Protein of unknown function (DUF2795)